MFLMLAKTHPEHTNSPVIVIVVAILSRKHFLFATPDFFNLIKISTVANLILFKGRPVVTSDLLVACSLAPSPWCQK